MSWPFRSLCAFLTLLLAVSAVQVGGCGPDMGSALAYGGALSDRHEGGAHQASPHDHDRHLAMAQDASIHQGHAAHDMSHPATPNPNQPAIHHDCIGCVAPIDIRVYRPVERLDFAASDQSWSLRPRALTDWSGAPETPPPQISV